MYVPTNIAAPTATYAPVTAGQNPAAIVQQTQALSTARQTELALTGLGPALVPNTVFNRAVPSGNTRSNTVSAPVVETAEGSLTETLASSGLSLPLDVRGTPQGTLLAPRPAYIAAQFLAQDLSPDEVVAFFSPEVQSEISHVSEQQQNQLRDMRQALGLEQGAANTNRITIKAPVLAPTTTHVSDVPLPAAPARAQQAPVAATAAARPTKRGTIVQAYGESAYEAANIRNALLASPPEIDTKL